jgi:hypothetical protein
VSIGQSSFQGDTYGGRNTLMFCLFPNISFLRHLYKRPFLPGSEYPVPFPTFFVDLLASPFARHAEQHRYILNFAHAHFHARVCWIIYIDDVIVRQVNEFSTM